MTDHIPFEHVSPEDAKKSATEREQEATKFPDLSAKYRYDTQKQPPPNIKLLLPWVSQLPPEIRPRELVVQYARIANKLAELWRYPLVCEKYLNELMLDERGDRQGFPQAVAQELTRLHAYYTTHVIKQHYTVWGDRVGE
jgi:hypothetical protein